MILGASKCSRPGCPSKEYLDLESGQNNGPVSHNKRLKAYRQDRVHLFWAILPVLSVLGSWSSTLGTLESTYMELLDCHSALGWIPSVRILHGLASTLTSTRFSAPQPW